MPLFLSDVSLRKTGKLFMVIYSCYKTYLLPDFFNLPRLECARLILEGHADFARMNPSDLIILGNIDFGDTMIAGEIRYSPNGDEYY